MWWSGRWRVETGEVPADVVQRAAELAVWFSKARGRRREGVGPRLPRPGRVAPAGRAAGPGDVIREYETMKVYSRDPGKRAD
jgi:hypothetical protein